MLLLSLSNCPHYYNLFSAVNVFILFIFIITCNFHDMVWAGQSMTLLPFQDCYSSSPFMWPDLPPIIVMMNSSPLFQGCWAVCFSQTWPSLARSWCQSHSTETFVCSFSILWFWESPPTCWWLIVIMVTFKVPMIVMMMKETINNWWLPSRCWAPCWSLQYFRSSLCSCSPLFSTDL